MPTLQSSDPTGLEIVAVVPPDGPRELAPDGELIVEPGQWALLFLQGRALDRLPPGRHLLPSTELPLLSEMRGPSLPGGEPLEVQVVFVSSRAVRMKWGTREPVVRSDDELGVVELRGFGTFEVGVATPETFVDALVGKLGLRSTDAIEAHLRQIVVARLGKLLLDDSLSLVDLLARPAELAGRLGTAVAGDFTPLGVELRQLVIGEITPPPRVARRVEARTAGADEGATGGAWSRGDWAPVGVASSRSGPVEEPAVHTVALGRGAPRPVACPECGRAPVAGASFCAFCGTRLDP